jgi:heptaprenyl diphosphate synthase
MDESRSSAAVASPPQRSDSLKSARQSGRINRTDQPEPVPAGSAGGSADTDYLSRWLQLKPLQDDLRRVEELLLRELSGRERFLDEITTHLAAAGGKRLRPILTLCGAYAAQRGSDLEPAPEAAIVAAAAVEALHLCSLYHDDVMDEAHLRRGVPSVNARWTNTVAVIGGDILLARAFRLGTSIGSAEAAELAWALEELCAGQADELSSVYDAGRDESAYETSVAGKTAALLVASLRAGGLAGGLGQADLDQLATAGHELGMAFQLVDDLLDLLGTPGAIGKPAGADIAEGVYTLPVILELRTNAELRALLESPPSAAQAEQARQLVVAGTGPATAAERAHQHIARAEEALAGCELHPDVRRAVSRLSDLLFKPLRALEPALLAAS